MTSICPIDQQKIYALDPSVYSKDTTKQSLEAYGEKLESEDIQLIEHDMTELRTALDQNNLDGLEELFKALEVSAYRIAEALYGTSQS